MAGYLFKFKQVSILILLKMFENVRKNGVRKKYFLLNEYYVLFCLNNVNVI